uniref:Plant natriuretic peptide-like 14 n=1 Tax=Venturia inaequalis TaxID=5025 RepID=A0A513ZS89_VENIN|nr:plant natriuretic peptide-like 14 [Venturia inaequalis]
MKVTTALIAISSFAYLGLCDVGRATTYKPPYLPTKCYGNRKDQFPPGNYFAAAGPGIWDNGAACGRTYEITCLSTGGIGHCTGATIQISRSLPHPPNFSQTPCYIPHTLHQPTHEKIKKPYTLNISSTPTCPHGYILR